MKEEEDKAKLQLLKYYIGADGRLYLQHAETLCLSDICEPLRKLIMKDSLWSWHEIHDQAVEKIKTWWHWNQFSAIMIQTKNLPYIWFFWEGIGCGSFTTRKTISICQQSPYRHWGKICSNRERTFSCCFRTWKVPSIYLWTKRNSSEWS